MKNKTTRSYRVKLNGIEKKHEYEELVKIFLRPDEFTLFTEEEAIACGKTADESFDLIVPYDNDKNVMKAYIYRHLSEFTGMKPPWGIITGIRPVKLTGEHAERIGYEETFKKLRDYYLISDEKSNLALNLYKKQIKRFGRPHDSSVGIYAGIPFCPTRCLYCSFASNQVESPEMDRYLDAFQKEAKWAKDFIDNKNLYVESVYIGGGTPTALNARQLERFLAMLDDLAKDAREYTLEAGRADTIGLEKMRIAKSHGIGRISINPQSMNEETLRLIGREHTPGDVRKAFDIARRAGIENINSDVIAGLPKEDSSEIAYTLDEILKLEPTDITVHSLTLKRGSRLAEMSDDIHYKKGDVVTEMLSCAGEKLLECGYGPYYLYRQKHMSGAQENTGYAKPGFEGLYNVRIMDEHQSIIALGAGGVSKVYFPKENRLERVADVKNYEIYIGRIDEMIERKEKAFALRYGM